MPHSILFMAQNHPSGKPLHDYCLKTFFLSDQVFLRNFFIDWGHKTVSEDVMLPGAQHGSSSPEILLALSTGGSFMNT